MIELFNLHENIYKIGLPIIILNGGIFKDDENSPAYIKMVMQNITNKTIKSVTMDMHVFDKANNVVELIRDYVYYADGADRDGLIGVGNYNYLNHEKPSSMSIAVKSVAFTDDAVWQGSSSLLFEAMPSKMPLEDYFNDIELAEQYQRDFSEKFATAEDVSATTKPFIHKDLWCCSCGRFNHDYEENCSACGANHKEQIEYLQDYVLISDNLKAYKENQEKSIKNDIAKDDFYDDYFNDDDFIPEEKLEIKSKETILDKAKKIFNKKATVEVKDEIQETISEESNDEISEKVVEDVKEEISEEVIEDAHEEINEKVVEEVKEEISEEVVEEVKDEISEEVVEEVEEEINEEVVEYVKEEISEEVEEEYEEEPKEKKLDILDFANEVEELPEEKEKKIVLTDKVKKTVFISAIVLIVAVVIYLCILLFYIIPNQEELAKSMSASLLNFINNFWWLI